MARHGNGYRFTAGPEALDLNRFRALVTDARTFTGRAEPTQALERYAEALHLVQGRAGDGLADTPGARVVFANLDDEFLEAVLAAAGIAVRLHRPARMLAPLRRAAEMEPLHELVQASLVTTLAAAGHRAEALTTYRVIRTRLADELGIDPGSDLQQAYRRILRVSAAPAGFAKATRRTGPGRRPRTARDG
nr:AfsR/SARP family transcriptional regulator [Actinoplanes subtropicus]